MDSSVEYVKCSIGDLIVSECHKLDFSRKKGIKNISLLSEENQEILHLRTGIKSQDLKTICLHHEILYLQKYAIQQKICSDPLKRHKVPIKTYLRSVSLQQSKRLLMKGYALKPGDKLCTACRKIILIHDTHEVTTANILIQQDTDLNIEDENSLERTKAVENLNASLTEIGCSPLKLHGLPEHSKALYGKRKLKTFEEKARVTMEKALKVLVPSAESTNATEEKARDMETLVEVMKNNLKNAPKKKQIQLLTIAASLSWSRKKIVETFGVSNYLAQKAKNLYKEKGLIANPNPYVGKKLPHESATCIQNFYESDDISRILPGMKDCISIRKENGEKLKVSKRLVLCNLKEAYVSFKEKYPNVKVSFSKFAELRPKNCILAGQSGTHTVCVCTIHQNIKLMIENAKFDSLTDGELKTYKHCLAKTLCNPASIDCYLRKCTSCPGAENIRDLLQNALEEKDVEKITFNQWLAVDRCNLETIEKTAAEFVDFFCEKLLLLAWHDFVAQQQSLFISETKNNLNDKEFLIICDFSENYTFMIQDEVQSFHWTSNQATIHPFAIYYKVGENIRYVSLVIISECLEHNTVAVYCFQKKLIKFLRLMFGENINKIFYCSDGAAAQYKNKKNFLNLCHHKMDFDIVAEWHFSATAHGKGPCDGVGGTVKRLAAKASLQRPYQNQITTAIDLFHWAEESIPAVNFVYVNKTEYLETEKQLINRFAKSVTIKGTQKLHAFIPFASKTSEITVKTFSNSSESTIEKVTVSENGLMLSEANGYVGIVYNQKWYVAYVLDKNDKDELKVSFLHPSGPSPSFIYPANPDILWVSITQVLCVLNPVTPTGRAYILPSKEIEEITKIYNDFM